MKKKLILFCIVILLISISLSGCNENSSKKNDKNKFIGTWIGISNYLNDSFNVTLTFFKDNSLKQVSEGEHVHWFNYELDDTCLYFRFPELPENYGICYYYEFSNNNNSLTLTNESFDTLILNKQ